MRDKWKGVQDAASVDGLDFNGLGEIRIDGMVAGEARKDVSITILLSVLLLFAQCLAPKSLLKFWRAFSHLIPAPIFSCVVLYEFKFLIKN